MFGFDSALWINRTQPAILSPPDYYSLGITAPDKAFPFARLASVASADNSATYLYLQINGTTFAEKWSVSLNAWEPAVYITISGF